jgi:alkylhydroperoxidase family enzyme
MSKLTKVSVASKDQAVIQILDKSRLRLGKVPNMILSMANSPIVADLYMDIQASLQQCSLSPELIELIAITVADANTCNYCLCAHTAKGKLAYQR